MPAVPFAIRASVVAAYVEGKGSYVELATLFKVGNASLRRWVSSFRATGKFEARPCGGGRARKVSDDELPALLAFVKEKPDRKVIELTAAWRQRTGTELSRSAMLRALHRAGLSFKKSL